ETGGVQMNVVPKEGGNTVKLYFLGTGATPGMTTSNLDDALRARGVPLAPKSSSYDWGGGVGGPIRKDRLWFYTAHRWWGGRNDVAGNYYNKNQGKYIGDPNSGVALYEPDLSKPGFYKKIVKDNSVRLTWQLTARHKVNASMSLQDNCSCYLGVDA